MRYCDLAKFGVLAFVLGGLMGCQEAAQQTAGPVAPVPPEQTKPVAQPAPPGQPPQTTPKQTTDMPNDPFHANLQKGSEVEVKPEATGAVPFQRVSRRMDLGQLNQAIIDATGGIAWTEGSKDTNQFDALSATLGKPDYIQAVMEDLSPGTLFQKFLADGAHSVCAKLVEKELAAEPAERVLMVHSGPEDTLQNAPDKIEANLQMLLLRYHGRSLEAGSPGLDSWRWLFKSTTHLSGSPPTGWRAVCVGLITHPRFYSY